jgi:hypothetical protein
MNGSELGMFMCVGTPDEHESQPVEQLTQLEQPCFRRGKKPGRLIPHPPQHFLLQGSRQSRARPNFLIAHGITHRIGVHGLQLWHPTGALHPTGEPQLGGAAHVGTEQLGGAAQVGAAQPQLGAPQLGAP